MVLQIFCIVLYFQHGRLPARKYDKDDPSDSIEHFKSAALKDNRIITTPFSFFFNLIFLLNLLDRQKRCHRLHHWTIQWRSSYCLEGDRWVLLFSKCLHKQGNTCKNLSPEKSFPLSCSQNNEQKMLLEVQTSYDFFFFFCNNLKCAKGLVHNFSPFSFDFSLLISCDNLTKSLRLIPKTIS